MKSVFHQTDRLVLSHRLDAVTGASTPRWGRMDSRQMLTHLTDSVRMALGELAVKPRPGPLRLPPIRHAIIHWLPFPRSAPTAPELLAALEGAREWPEHPTFGRLRSRDWGVLTHRHVDHHLRQFGA
jgi:hypothetical protein